MSPGNPVIQSALLFKGGPSLLNLLIDANEFQITVTGPRMLFEQLQLVTTLSAFEGYTALRLREFAAQLEGTIHCGLVGIEHAEIAVKPLRSGGVMTISLGPPSMYQSLLILRTRSGESFRTLFERVFLPQSTEMIFAGLQAVPASGHLERHHGSGQDSHGGHDTGGHHGEAGGHHGHP
jgi:hypothetical protein